jgi:pimeloyl-ACP methyl ester carboxylesterase
MKRKWLIGSALLVLSITAVWLQYRADLSTAQKSLSSGSRIAHTACGPIEYAVTGRGPAVLLVHGAGGGYSQMADISELLAAAGFQAIAMSRFGYLRTPLPADRTPSAQARAHACLLDALGLSRAAAVGLSAGAPSALEFCALHAERCSALVLLVPAIALPGRALEQSTPPSPFWQFVFDHVLQSDFVIWGISRVWPEMLVETVLATPTDVFRRASADERQRALGVIRDIFPVSLRGEGLRHDALTTTSAPLHTLRRITAPTLAISASDDLYDTDAGAAHLADQIVGARLILLPDGGHAWLGHHAQVQDEVIRFLQLSLAKEIRTSEATP